MQVILPIPIFRDGVFYPAVNIIKPKMGILADTRKTADGGDFYSAMYVFLSGCSESIEKEDGTIISDRISVKSLIRNIPYRSAELLAIKIITEVDDDDGIEGVYECPMCHNKVFAQIIENDGVVETDTRDFIRDLPVNIISKYTPTFIHNFASPVNIVDSGEEMLESVSSIEFYHPTLAHCISAFAKYGLPDEVRFQLGVYVDAIKKINGRDVDSRWKNMFGMLLFENIDDSEDVKKITAEVNRYGMRRSVRKNCNKCGKSWTQNISTSNFFVSSLRQ
jgi:hypothetical protein